MDRTIAALGFEFMVIGGAAVIGHELTDTQLKWWIISMAVPWAAMLLATEIWQEWKIRMAGRSWKRAVKRSYQQTAETCRYCPKGYPMWVTSHRQRAPALFHHPSCPLYQATAVPPSTGAPSSPGTTGPSTKPSG